MDNEVENEVVDPKAADATPDAAAELTSLFESVLNEDDAVPNDGSDGKPANAPAEGNLKAEKPDAPVDGKPAEKEANTVTEVEDPAKDGATDQKDEDDALFNEMLDVKPEERIEDLTVLKTRYSEATRRIGELNDQYRQINEVLASQGRQIVLTKDGPKIAVTENAPEFAADAVDVGSIFKTLTPAEQDLFADDPEKATRLIAEKAIKQVAEKFLPAQATKNDIVLTGHDKDSLYTDFVQSKLSDGKSSRYPDADNPEVKDMMAKAYNAQTPEMDKLRDLADKDKVMHKIMLEHLFLKTFRARHAKLSVLAAKKAATEETKKKLEREPKVSSGGSAQTVKGQQPRQVASDLQSRFEAHLDDM